MSVLRLKMRHHPEIWQIEESIFWGYFQYYPEPSIVASIITLAKTPDDALLPLIKKKFSNVWYRETAFMTLAVSHPNLTLDALKALSAALNLSNSATRTCFIALGNKAFFEQQFNNRFTQEEFITAARYGNLLMLQHIVDSFSPEELPEVIAAEDYRAFRFAAENGHLAVLEYLEEKAPGKLQEMIAAGGYAAFCFAAQRGHLEVLHYLARKNPEQLEVMITVKDYDAFFQAARNGHLAVLEYFEEKAADHLQKMIAVDNYQVFSWVAGKGHLAVLQYLVSKIPEALLPEVITAANYLAFRWAAEMGHLAVLEYLEEKAPKKIHEMIAAKNYEAFRRAAQSGHLDVLRYLAQKSPEQLEAMMSENDCEAFREASKNAHIAVLSYLVKNAPESLKEMIATKGYARQIQEAEDRQSKIPKIIEQLIKNIDGRTPSTRVTCFSFGKNEKINQLRAIRDWYMLPSDAGTEAQKEQFALMAIKTIVSSRRNPLGFYKPHSLNEFDTSLKEYQLVLDEQAQEPCSAEELARLKKEDPSHQQWLSERFCNVLANSQADVNEQP